MWSWAEGWLEWGDCREPLAEWEHIAQLGRSDFEGMQVRGHWQNRMKEWDACLYIGRDMIETNPELPQGWINHGNALFYLNRYKEAFDLLFPDSKLATPQANFHYRIWSHIDRLLRSKS